MQSGALWWLDTSGCSSSIPVLFRKGQSEVPRLLVRGELTMAGLWNSKGAAEGDAIEGVK